MVTECLHTLAYIKFIKNFIHQNETLYLLFEANFRIVRYEDLAHNMFANAERIYHFGGLDFPYRVKKHINSEKYADLAKPTKFDEENNIN